MNKLKDQSVSTATTLRNNCQNNGWKARAKANGELPEQFLCSLCKTRMLVSSETVDCTFCGKKEKADYVCPKGHYVCEDCRLASAEKLVRKVCEVTRETDPMKIAVMLMKHPTMEMHGPDHHYLISCALLAALRNLGKFEIGKLEFDQAVTRGKRVLLGSCGLWGVCGSAAAVGIAVSVVTKATMMSDKERSLSMQAVSEVLSEIAEIGGPRCCKASTFAALETAAKFFERTLGIRFSALENPRPCYFKALNDKGCLGERCPYYK